MDRTSGGLPATPDQRQDRRQPGTGTLPDADLDDRRESDAGQAFRLRGLVPDRGLRSARQSVDPEDRRYRRHGRNAPARRRGDPRGRSDQGGRQSDRQQRRIRDFRTGHPGRRQMEVRRTRFPASTCAGCMFSITRPGSAASSNPASTRATASTPRSARAPVCGGTAGSSTGTSARSPNIPTSQNSGRFKTWIGHDIGLDWRNVFGVRDLTLRGGVFNLGDAAPPADTSNPASVVTYYDAVRGRTFYLSLRAKW